MIQGSFLVNVTKTPSGAPLGGSRMFLDATRMAGFGLLRDVTVYPHFFARPAAEKDMLTVVARYPDLLGIGIDEGAAIVAHGDRFEVIGRGHVGVFNGKTSSRKKSLTLSPGQTFDMKSRTAVE